MDYLSTNYLQEFDYIINTSMKLNVKKELLTQLLLKLDNEPNTVFRKKFIQKIQKVLHVLDTTF